MEELSFNDIFEYENDIYCVIDKITYSGNIYYFLNKMINEDEHGKEFKLLKYVGGKLIPEENKKIENEVYYIVTVNFNKKIDTYRDMIKEE